MYSKVCVSIYMQRQSKSTGNNIIMKDNPDLSTYTRNGFTCFECPPGTYVDIHCTENFTHSVCNQCPDGSFQSNYSQATRCSHCNTFCLHDNNMEVVDNCTPTQDMKCQCQQGYHLVVVDKVLKTIMCKKHRTCPEQQVILRNGTPTSDTECGYCPDGEFSRKGQCAKCSSCDGRNLTELAPCNATADAQCGQHQNNGNITASTGVITTRNLQQTGGLGHLWIVIPVVCLLVIPCAISLLVIGHRHIGQRGKTIILGDDSPLIHRALPTNPNSSKRQRTLSGSSITSARSESIFPDIPDKDVWRNEVFTLLSARLGTDWKRFMRKLPGNKEYHSAINSRCDQIHQEEPGDVREQIYKALNEWSNSNEEAYVKMDSLLDTLYDMYASDQTLYNDVNTLCCRLATQKKTALSR